MPASKKATTTRRAQEFKLAELLRMIQPPQDSSSSYGWGLDEIRAAVDMQLAGKFASPVRLAKRMGTDHAAFVARNYRLAPQRAIGVRVVGQKSTALTEASALFGPRGKAVTPSVMSDINATLADHGIAIGYNTWIPREDGSRVDVVHKEWPLEYVEYDTTTRQLFTRVDQSSNVDNINRVPIVHGDGLFTVYSKHDREPWTHDAAIIAAGLLWSLHAFGLRDLASSSKAHGLAKAKGELPEGMKLDDGNGNLSPDALAFVQMAVSLLSGTGIFGLAPSGAKLDWIANPSNAWQVFDLITAIGEKGFARIYTGTDGILGSVGGAPGVDITALFGVATTIVQGDLGALENGFSEGVIEPWCAINHGDSSYQIRREYMLPDADAQAEREQFATRRDRFWTDVKSMRDNGCIVDQEAINDLAARYDVPAPTLASATTSTAAFYAYELDGGVVTIDEVRASKGLPPLPNGAGALTVPQAKAAAAAAVTAPPTDTASQQIPPATTP